MRQSDTDIAKPARKRGHKQTYIHAKRRHRRWHRIYWQTYTGAHRDKHTTSHPDRQNQSRDIL